jgi:hypothetical protein
MDCLGLRYGMIGWLILSLLVLLRPEKQLPFSNVILFLSTKFFVYSIDEDFDRIEITRNKFHREWNYAISLVVQQRPKLSRQGPDRVQSSKKEIDLREDRRSAGEK